MNRKAVLFSASVVIFIIFLLTVLRLQEDVRESEDDFRIKRSQILIMDNFIRDFDRSAVPNILATALKPTLIETSKFGPVDRATLAAIMKQGSGELQPKLATDANVAQTLATLTFDVDHSFEFVLANAQQTSHDTFLLTFLVDYAFSEFDITWSRNKYSVAIPMDVYSLTHPEHGLITDAFVQDQSGCLITDIITDASPCTNAYNLKPPEPSPIP